MTTKCILCGNETFFPAAEFHKDLVRCNKCSLVFYRNIYEVLPDTIYDNKYFEGRYYNYLLDKPVTQKNFTRRLKVIRNFKKDGKLLEIGIAYGFFLVLAKKYFDVYGIDIVEDGTRYAKESIGLSNVICGDYLGSLYPDNNFDAICMFDTIEHLKEPHLFVEKASRELKSGGVICLTTGDIESLMARTQKSKWRLINPPTHLFYFSYQTLKQLLEKYGFEIIYRSYPGYFRSLAFMLYLTFFKEKNKLTEGLLFKMLQKISIYLNLYDIMFVIARKRGV